MDENRARNIPALTRNQLAVIYKLIWYQDGYEQPSEEDLKRIMIVSVIVFLIVDVNVHQFTKLILYFNCISTEFTGRK